MAAVPDGHSVVGVLAAIGTGALWVAAEFLAEAAAEGLLYLLWRLFRAPFRPAETLPPALGLVSLALLGAAVGGVSYWVHSARLLFDPGPRGLSLLIAPILVGGAMEALGRWQRRRGRPTPLLTSFFGGATFAASMALARYILFF